MKKIAKKKDARQEESSQTFLSRVLRMELRELVLTMGLREVSAMLEQEREQICGPRYAHDPKRRAHRGGHAPGRVVLGGRRMTMPRPRVRGGDGREVELSTWRDISEEDPLEKRAVNQMLVGVATRKYAQSLEPLPSGISESGVSKSAVSRRFVAATGRALEEWIKRDLSELDIVAIMLDGVHLGEHVALVALGIDLAGNKHILGLHEGATENATACTALLAELVERKLRTDRRLLFVIDGGKALRKAVRDVFGRRAEVQRCQIHKRRNVLEHLPESMRRAINAALSQAYASETCKTARRRLVALANQLNASHPSAAASILEGLDETLTVMRLGLKGDLARILSSTNSIENIMGSVQHTSRNVRRWQGGTMVLRWMAASLQEASKGFRRIKGYRDLPALVSALQVEAEHAVDGEVLAA